MATRRNLKGVAANVASSFVSRNNDIGGYWAIGKLYSLALKHGQHHVTVDLLSGDVLPANNICTEMTENFRNMLLRNVVSAGLAHANVASAKCVIEFDRFDRVAHKQFRYGPPHPQAPRPFVCTLSIVDDHSKVYSASVGGWSHPHNSLREMRSARVTNRSRQVIQTVYSRLGALIRFIAAPRR